MFKIIVEIKHGITDHLISTWYFNKAKSQYNYNSFRSDKMKYKLIAIDMDGTFLNEERNITERNLKSVKKAVDMGVKVVISSGRIPSALGCIIKDMPKNQPVIACNGSIILDHNHEEIAHETIANGLVIKIISYIRENFNEVFYNVFCEDIIYSERLHPFSEKFNEYNLSLPEEYRLKSEVISDLKQYVINCTPRVSKIEIYDEDSEKIDAIKKYLEDIFDVEVVMSGKTGIEITKKGMSKGSSLETLAKHYGYTLDECIAIGNDGNDIEMIKRAGLGVAVSNAHETVKAVAKYITIRDNDNDAVSEVIEKFVV